MSHTEPSPALPTAGATGGTAARRAARAARGADDGRDTPGDDVAGSPSPSAPPRPPRRGDAEVRRQLDPDALAALEDERDFLLASLADLEREHDAGDVDDTDYAELKDDYTARTAAVLRSLDERRVLAREGAPGRSWRGVAVALVAVVLFAAVGGVLLARASGTRGPGDGVTGDIRLSSRDLLLQAGQLTGQGRQALEAGDADGAYDLYSQAIEAYQQVLEIDPGNPEALALQAWLLHNIALQSTSGQAGQLDAAALQLLDEAVASDAAYAPARIFRASLFVDLSRYADAQADLDTIDPASVPSFLTDRFAGLQADVAAGVAAQPAAQPAG